MLDAFQNIVSNKYIGFEWAEQWKHASDGCLMVAHAAFATENLCLISDRIPVACLLMLCHYHHCFEHDSVCVCVCCEFFSSSSSSESEYINFLLRSFGFVVTLSYLFMVCNIRNNHNLQHK